MTPACSRLAAAAAAGTSSAWSAAAPMTTLARSTNLVRCGGAQRGGAQLLSVHSSPTLPTPTPTLHTTKPTAGSACRACPPSGYTAESGRHLSCSTLSWGSMGGGSMDVVGEQAPAGSVRGIPPELAARLCASLADEGPLPPAPAAAAAAAAAAAGHGGSQHVVAVGVERKTVQVQELVTVVASSATLGSGAALDRTRVHPELLTTLARAPGPAPSPDQVALQDSDRSAGLACPACSGGSFEGGRPDELPFPSPMPCLTKGTSGGAFDEGQLPDEAYPIQNDPAATSAHPDGGPLRSV